MRGQTGWNHRLRMGHLISRTFEQMMEDPRGNTFIEWSLKRRIEGWNGETAERERREIRERF
jgi:hypothetical protein